MIISKILNRPVVMILLSMRYKICTIKKHEDHYKVFMSSIDNKIIVTVLLYKDYYDIRVHVYDKWCTERYNKDDACSYNIGDLLDIIENYDWRNSTNVCYLKIRNNIHLSLPIYSVLTEIAFELDDGLKFRVNKNIDIINFYDRIDIYVIYKNQKYNICHLKNVEIKNCDRTNIITNFKLSFNDKWIGIK